MGSPTAASAAPASWSDLALLGSVLWGYTASAIAAGMYLALWLNRRDVARDAARMERRLAGQTEVNGAALPSGRRPLRTTRKGGVTPQ